MGPTNWRTFLNNIPFIDFGNNPFIPSVTFYIPPNSFVLTWNSSPTQIPAEMYNDDVEMNLAIGLTDKDEIYRC